MTKSRKADADLIRQSGLFDIEWYLKQYPDVKSLGMDSIEHYLWIGALLGRDPSTEFSTSGYLAANQDIATARINPLVHYIRRGRAENRQLSGPAKTHAPLLNCRRILARHSKKWDQLRENAFLASLDQTKINLEQIKASIIMPTRDRAECIQRAISSVIAQTHTNWELIIVDDGSQDDTAHVVAAASDARIKYFKNETGLGVSAARNKGLVAACGDWLFFLDSDNSWRPSMLERMLKFATMSGLSATYCGAIVQDDDGKTTSFLYSDFEMESCLAANYIDMNCFCVKREAAPERFDEELKRLVDWDYILRIASHTTLVGAPFIGVEYYDGDRYSRITRQIHNDKKTFEALVNTIRVRAKNAILEQQTAKGHRKAKRAAVVLHVYHKEYIAQCLAYLKNIALPYDLFVTTSHNLDDTDIATISREVKGAILLQYPNVGSDIAPFLQLMSTLATYDLVCKIHTKRDVGKWGGAWRDYMLHSMLGSRKIVDAIIASFDNDHDVAAAGGAPFYKLGEVNSIPETRDRVKKLATLVGFGEHLSSNWGFFAGTMFWVRPHLLSGLARFACDHPSYSQSFQHDGAIEHAWERLMGMAFLRTEGSKIAACTINRDLTYKIEMIPAEGGEREGITVTLDKIIGSGIDFARKRDADTPGKLKVTTVIPTYNQQRFIRSAIDSAVIQIGDFEHEILISDDGSSDGTNAIVDEYVRKYPKLIRSIGSRENCGISENFRKCFREARGKYIAILEGDDFWSSNQKLNKQVQFLEGNEDCSMVFSKIEVLNENNGTQSVLQRQDNISKNKLDGGDFILDPNLNLIANFSCCLFRSDLMKQAPEAIFEKRINEIAVAFYLDNYGKIGFINEALSVYRMHPLGVWSGSSRRPQLESGLETRRNVLKVARERYANDINRIIRLNFTEPLSRLEAVAE